MVIFTWGIAVLTDVTSTEGIHAQGVADNNHALITALLD